VKQILLVLKKAESHKFLSACVMSAKLVTNGIWTHACINQRRTL